MSISHRDYRDQVRREQASYQILAALKRLVTVVEGFGPLRHPGDALDEAKKAIAAAEPVQ
jgi:hypothetical protein